MSTNPQFISRLMPAHPRFYATAIICGCLVVVLLVFWATTLSMVSIWERSETFTHGFLVFPIFLYLLWTKRKELESLEPEPFHPALIGIAAGGCIWLAGQLAAAVSVSQLGMMAMVPFAVWAILGTRIARALAFPLAFLFFAVPFGELLVPRMMDWTADFTVVALRVSGVPVFREGNYFTIPSGRWSVVEACSGLRYLIASLMIGCLFAILMYRSAARRLAFIAASLIVPIIANWLRAYGVVMLAHLTNNRLATGVDHLIYGWIFFGIVMLALFQVGSWWREDEPVSKEIEPRRLHAAYKSRQARLLSAGLITIVMIAIWQPALSAIESRRPVIAPGPIAITGNSGWRREPGSIADWRPDIKGATVESTMVFEKDGSEVGVFVALFAEQTFDARAITSSNTLVQTTNRPWEQIDRGVVNVSLNGQAVAAKSTLIIGPSLKRLVAWHWYWVDGKLTTSDFMAKLYQLAGKLRGHGDPTAWVVLYTPADGDEAKANALLSSFSSQMAPAIDAALDVAVGRQP